STAWSTVYYIGNPLFGGYPKEGVGMIIDLGSPKAVSQMELIMAVQGADLSIMVPNAAPGEVAEPPKSGMDQWRSIGDFPDVGERVSLALEEAETTRFVLIVFTKLGPDGGRYCAGVAEI